MEKTIKTAEVQFFPSRGIENWSCFITNHDNQQGEKDLKENLNQV